MQRPLDGLKVLDFSQNLPGPYATFLLTGWGADVVKVEPPKGDPARSMEPFFSIVNRGKRSVMLDLRDEASRPALEALVRWADVVVEGFRPGVMDRLGCGYEAARALNPRVIYCSISAFGQNGPLRDHPGHDLDLQALSGVCHLERDAAGTPRGALLPIADLSSAFLAVSAISAARLAQKERGEGAYLDVAMADGVLSFANVWGVGIDFSSTAGRKLRSGGVIAATLGKPLLDVLERLKLYAMPHYGVFKTRDGRYLSLGIVDEGHFWRSLCEELGLTAFAKLDMPARIASGPLLRPLVAMRIRRRTLADWTEALRRRGIPSAPVLRPGEAAEEAQVATRPCAPGADGWLGSPLPGASALVGSAPKKGEHTQSTLQDLGVA
ncbi:MAG: CaiB/BaiF CoA transferase family protein [Sandaracinaceae bacterium]